jgi:hypothetical protein
MKPIDVMTNPCWLGCRDVGAPTNAGCGAEKPLDYIWSSHMVSITNKCGEGNMGLGVSITIMAQAAYRPAVAALIDFFENRNSPFGDPRFHVNFVDHSQPVSECRN